MAMVFARQMTSDLASLVKAIDAKVAASNGKASSFVAFLPADPKALQPKLEEAAAQDKLVTPLTIAVDNADAARKFNLTPTDNMPVTVVLYRDKKARKVYNFESIKDSDVQTVAAAFEEISK